MWLEILLFLHFDWDCKNLMSGLVETISSVMKGSATFKNRNINDVWALVNLGVVLSFPILDLYFQELLATCDIKLFIM